MENPFVNFILRWDFFYVYLSSLYYFLTQNLLTIMSELIPLNLENEFLSDPEKPVLNPSQVQGVWIPAEIFFNNNLNSTEKLVLGEVYNLSPKDGSGCYASNKYLSELIGMSEGSLANCLTSLRKKDYLQQISWDGRIRRMICTLKLD